MEREKRILVVEDSSGFRKLLALVFGKTGYEFFEATNGLEAIERARAIQPDLIIMDIELPGMFGDEVILRLKADESTSHIPVIVTTSYDRDDTIVRSAKAAGAAMVLYKPTPMKVFEEEVRRFLNVEPKPTGD